MRLAKESEDGIKENWSIYGVSVKLGVGRKMKGRVED